MKVPVTVKGQN
jgi:hypothetical protein